jgi:hypothetical protein
MTSHGLDVVRLSMLCTPIYVVPEGGSNQTLEDNVVVIFICLTEPRSHTTLVIIPFLTRFFLWLTFPYMRIHTKNLNFRRERASHEVWIIKVGGSH